MGGDGWGRAASLRDGVRRGFDAVGTRPEYLSAVCVDVAGVGGVCAMPPGGITTPHKPKCSSHYSGLQDSVGVGDVDQVDCLDAVEVRCSE